VLSIHEEATFVAEGPMMGVFNNLVVFDQHVKQNSQDSIVPDLATGWSWNEDGTDLTFPLRDGVRWHDGKPFTAVGGDRFEVPVPGLAGIDAELLARLPGQQVKRATHVLGGYDRMTDRSATISTASADAINHSGIRAGSRERRR
jgi:hypothetical protein